MVWRGSADIEDFRSQAALFLIQAVDRKDWGIDAPGLYYNFILNRMADWVRNHKPGKRLFKGTIQFCNDRCLFDHALLPSQEPAAELSLIDRRANDRQRSILRLMLGGFNQYEVSEHIHISQSLVSRELKALAA